MAVIKDITMHQYNGTDYDTLYPKTTSQQILLNDSELANLYGVDSTNGTVNDVLQNTGIVKLNGVYSAPPPSHVPDTLDFKTYNMGTAPIPGACLLAGGVSDSFFPETDKIIKYDLNGIQTQAPYLTNLVSKMASGSLLSGAQSRSFFAGGETKEPHTVTSHIDVYNENLVKLTMSASLTDPVFNSGCAIIGDYFIVAGGRKSFDNYSYSDSVTGYNFSLVKQTLTSLSAPRSEIGSGSIMNSSLGVPSIGFFVGGNNGENVLNNIDSYTNNLVHSTLTASQSISGLTGASSTKSSGYAMFEGGTIQLTETAPITSVYVYNESSVSQTIVSGRMATYGASGGNSSIYFEPGFIYFAGGVAPGYASSLNTLSCVPTVLTVDNNLLISLINYRDSRALQTRRAMMGGVCFGDSNQENAITLFAGGMTDTQGSSNSIDKYKNSYGAQLNIPPFSSYKFEGVHSEEQHTVNGLVYYSEDPITGYIRLGGLTLSGLLQ